MQNRQRFALHLNPIIVREVRTRMRGARPYLLLTVFLLLLMAAGFGMYQLVLQQARMGTMVLSAQIGQALFKGLAFIQLFFIVMVAPALTSGAISSEREHLTYDMILTTPLQPGQILWGKLIGALSYLFLLMFASLPLFSVVLVFGGVEPRALLKTLTLLLATTITFGAIGLFSSSLFQRTTRATLVSYVLVALMVGVPMLIAAVWGQFSNPQGQNPPPPLLYANPFSALQSMTTIAPPSDGVAVPFFGYNDPFAAIPFLNQLTLGVIWYGPMGVQVLPIYRGTLVTYALLTTILCWVSAHCALPTRRFRPRWSDLGFALVLLLIILLAWNTRSWWYLTLPDQQMPILPAKG